MCVRGRAVASGLSFAAIRQQRKGLLDFTEGRGDQMRVRNAFRRAGLDRWLAAAVCSIGVAANAAAATTGLSSPFVFSTVGVWTGVGNTVIPEAWQADAIGPVVVEAGSQPTAYGRFRAALGSNGFEAQGIGGIDREVDGGSVWSDGFTVTGGTGSGLLTMSTHLTGSISGLGQMGYALFVSSQPYDLNALLATVGANHNGFWALQLANSVRVMFTGVANGCGSGIWNPDCGHMPLQNYQGPMDVTLTAKVPFTYGQALYVATGFSGAVLTPGGSASFLHSADFAISAPAGATMAALSGSVYAAAVPEASIGSMLSLGIVVIAVARRRRMAI